MSGGTFDREIYSKGLRKRVERLSEANLLASAGVTLPAVRAVKKGTPKSSPKHSSSARRASASRPPNTNRVAPQPPPVPPKAQDGAASASGEGAPKEEKPKSSVCVIQ